MDPFSVIAALEHELALLSRALRQPADADSIQPGDLVQLSPEADPQFGGYFLYCSNASYGRARGPILASCRSTWRNVPVDQVARIGAARWPKPSLGFVEHRAATIAELEARNEAYREETARKMAQRQETLRTKAQRKAG